MARRLLPKIILFISLLINALFGWNYYSDNTVIKVWDGDTFDLKNGNRVRLLDVESPEMGDCGSEEAKKRLEELVLGKFVTVKELSYEPNNRDNGLVYQGGRLINEIMIKEGWGRLHYNPNSQKENLKAAFADAKANQRGIFGLGCTETEAPSKDCNIRGNIDQDLNKKVYYVEDCPDYWRVKIDTSRGEDYFCTEEQARAKGFIKASNCPKEAI
jgi:micrococcal nuclease